MAQDPPFVAHALLTLTVRELFHLFKAPIIATIVRFSCTLQVLLGTLRVIICATLANRERTRFNKSLFVYPVCLALLRLLLSQPRAALHVQQVATLLLTISLSVYCAPVAQLVPLQLQHVSNALPARYQLTLARVACAQQEPLACLTTRPSVCPANLANTATTTIVPPFAHRVLQERRMLRTA